MLASSKRTVISQDSDFKMEMTNSRYMALNLLKLTRINYFELSKIHVGTILIVLREN